MENFVFQNPTKIYFGKNAISNINAELVKFGTNVLLVYGGGSIKRNGLYDTVIQCLKSAGKNITELSGVMPNPRREKVYEGISYCKDKNIDFILAVGGGSVIDCSKFVAAGAKTDDDFWESYLVNQKICNAALPIGTILTLAGTGSEMNSGGVISDFENHLKLHYGSPLLFPKFSILDPSYTFSLPREQLIYGAVDAMSHILESYFSAPDISNVSDDLAESLFKSLMYNLDLALKKPKDYLPRSNLMWCCTLALNGLLSLGKEGDWMSHEIEHSLSAFYDIPHAVGLSIVHPNHLMYVLESSIPKFKRFAQNVFGIEKKEMTDEQIARAGISMLSNYFRSMNVPTTLGEINVQSNDIPKLAASVKTFPISYAPKYCYDDVVAVLTNSLEIIHYD
ncbi:MAG: iron-containing alcohol dehydrogenase [Christensenellaceae bacterium]|jgi:alcohol dehydrogenase YqhD (iron-dependent ADH family)|nr:iron-containing alcohol dehydrogenase [Christensenellaceae bacterium]